METLTYKKAIQFGQHDTTNALQSVSASYNNAFKSSYVTKLLIRQLTPLPQNHCVSRRHNLDVKAASTLSKQIFILTRPSWDDGTCQGRHVIQTKRQTSKKSVKVLKYILMIFKLISFYFFCSIFKVSDMSSQLKENNNDIQ